MNEFSTFTPARGRSCRACCGGIRGRDLFAARHVSGFQPSFCGEIAPPPGRTDGRAERARAGAGPSASRREGRKGGWRQQPGHKRSPKSEVANRAAREWRQMTAASEWPRAERARVARQVPGRGGSREFPPVRMALNYLRRLLTFGGAKAIASVSVGGRGGRGGRGRRASEEGRKEGGREGGRARRASEEGEEGEEGDGDGDGD